MLPFPWGWALIGLLIVYQTQLLVFHVPGVKNVRSLSETDLCSDACHITLLHTHTRTRTYTHAWINTHTAQGPVTAPWRGCWVWFYCLYWSWLGPSWGIDLWIIWVQGGGLPGPCHVQECSRITGKKMNKSANCACKAGDTDSEWAASSVHKWHNACTRSTSRCFLPAGSYIFTVIDIFHYFHGNQHWDISCSLLLKVEGVFFPIRCFNNTKYLDFNCN